MKNASTTAKLPNPPPRREEAFECISEHFINGDDGSYEVTGCRQVTQRDRVLGWPSCEQSLV